jgi:hypothetical protein
MMKNPQYSIFAKKVLDCKNLFELREVVGKINEFNKTNSIRASSDDFKKLETIVGLMKIKLRNKQGTNESKTFMVTEEQFEKIINESRLESLISDYLNQKNWRHWDIGDGEFNLADGEFGKDVIYFRVQNSSTVPDHEFNVIYINDDLISEITKLFTISPQNAIISVIGWFNMRFDKHLTKDDFEWMDHNSDYDFDDEEY